MSEEVFACIDAPGRYGDEGARVYETFDTLGKARAWCNRGGVVVYRGYYTKGERILRCNIQDLPFYPAAKYG